MTPTWSLLVQWRLHAVHRTRWAPRNAPLSVADPSLDRNTVTAATHPMPAPPLPNESAPLSPIRSRNGEFGARLRPVVTGQRTKPLHCRHPQPRNVRQLRVENALPNSSLTCPIGAVTDLATGGGCYCDPWKARPMVSQAILARQRSSPSGRRRRRLRVENCVAARALRDLPDIGFDNAGRRHFSNRIGRGLANREDRVFEDRVFKHPFSLTSECDQPIRWSADRVW